MINYFKNANKKNIQLKLFKELEYHKRHDFVELLKYNSHIDKHCNYVLNYVDLKVL